MLKRMAVLDTFCFRPRYFSMFCTTSLSWRSSRFLTWNIIETGNLRTHHTRTHFKFCSHHNCRQSSLKLLLQSIQLIQADLGNSTHVSTTVCETLTSVSPLFNIPVYLGHSGASISFSSKGKSFRSTDSPFPLTYESIQENVEHNIIRNRHCLSYLHFEAHCYQIFRALPFRASPHPSPW